MQTQIFRIVFEDPEILVIEKQKPFLSQRADEGDREGMDEFIGRTLGYRPFPVHRLDREVLGLMIYGKTAKAAEYLSEQFKSRSLTKIYWADVHGRMGYDSQTLVHYLRKNPQNNLVTVFPRETEGAKRAELQYTVWKREEKTTEVLVRLKTGRPHQIRAQLAKIGHPIRGDLRYGRSAKEEIPIQLKAVMLEIRHPRSHELQSWALMNNVDFKNFFAD